MICGLVPRAALVKDAYAIAKIIVLIVLIAVVIAILVATFLTGGIVKEIQWTDGKTNGIHRTCGKRV